MYFAIGLVAGNAYWWLVDGRGEPVCYSGTSFRRESAAIRAARSFRRSARSAEYLVYEAPNGQFRWKAVRGNRTLAISHIAFTSRNAAQLVAHRVRSAAGTAPGL